MLEIRLRHAVGMTAMIGMLACEAEEAPQTEPATESVPSVPAPEPPTTTPARSGTGATLAVQQTQEHGSYLSDGEGRALYMLEGEGPGSSNCYDACAEAWPPFLAEQGTPTSTASNVQSGMIGTITRRDGAMQVTYNGHPLYYYSKDQGPGQATGQDLTDEWGEWYLVTPQGQHVEE